MRMYLSGAMAEVYPSLVLAGGIPKSCPGQEGTQSCPSLGGVPHEVPPAWDWGTPGKDLGPETRERTPDWVPPGKVMGPEAGKVPGTRDWGTRLGCGQTYTCENSTFPILRMRAIIIRQIFTCPVRPMCVIRLLGCAMKDGLQADMY